ncbi:MAG: polyketide synthase dehydratase domain-containing protein, partial [Egibacteraceae bacterium]
HALSPSPSSLGPATSEIPAAVSVDASPAGIRDHVLDAYLATMDRFLDVQRNMMQSALASTAAPVAAERRFPLLGSVVSRTEGELVALRRFDLDEDLFLHDHAFGGKQVSMTDETLLALPVVPMTVSMEMCAEAALALCPGRVVVGMEAVRAYQWIDLEDGHATLRITGRRQDAADGLRVKVEVARLTEGTETGVRVAEGTVVLAEAYPAAEAATPLALEAERGYPYGAEDLYAGRMFHGPRFQGVVSLDRWGEQGTEATLRILPTADLFASTTDPDLIVDPQLLDAAGQIVGFWADEEHDYAALPFALEGLQRFADSPPPGTQVVAQARVRLLTDQQIRSDIDLVGPDGLLLARLTGWTNLCFPVPKPFNRPWASPRDATLGAGWPAMFDRLAVPAGFIARRMDLPATLMGPGAVMLRRAVVKLLLNRRERAIWADLRGSDRDRLDWLLRQAAAKECVRAFLEATHGIELYPADIEVVPGEHSRPVVTVPWARQLGRAPFVSVAHADGTAVAIAGDDGSCHGVGIALQRINPLDDAFDDLGLSSTEHDLLAALEPSHRHEWAVRLRCAKQAVGNALGTDLEHPSGLLADSLDLAAGGAIRLVTGRPPTSAFAASDAEPLTVRTIRDGDWIAAVAMW